MKYINKKLTIENTKVQNIAYKFGTPAYCYSFNQLKQNIIDFKRSFQSFSPIICFSIKSNCNANLLREIGKLGLGADVVSMGELMLAIKAGIKPKKIVFSGVGKTSNEISYAIDRKILLINAESISEIKEIDRIAKSKNKKVEIGIRLNPNTDANTLNQISTGKKDDKFGVNKKSFIKIIEYCKNSKNLELECLSVHIGSQILDYRPYEKMLRVINNIIKKINFKFKYIDLGGGMGIPYNKNSKKLNYAKYNSIIKKFLKKNKSKIIFEPGRSIIGDTAVLISRIIYIKENSKKDFIIIDAAMNDFMRPALYGAQHKIIPLVKKYKQTNKIYDFVGPICESTDKFLTTKKFQKLYEKEYVIICDVGAYGSSLRSNYNVRPKLAEILIKGSKINLIKKRQKLKDLI